MLTQDQFTKALDLLPFMREAQHTIQQEFQREAYFARIPSGHDIFHFGDRVDAIALLVSGGVRVYKIGDTGREITLYRINAGESCILTANSILNQQSFSAVATVEEPSEAIMIPADTFRKWVDHYDIWRKFVFELLSQRLSVVMEIVEEVAFGRMDVRVASLLLERSKASNPVIITHHEIATELGSSREVISRILSNMANRGMIQVKRGAIDIINTQMLEDYATV